MSNPLCHLGSSFNDTKNTAHIAFFIFFFFPSLLNQAVEQRSIWACNDAGSQESSPWCIYLSHALNPHLLGKNIGAAVKEHMAIAAACNTRTQGAIHCKRRSYNTSFVLQQASGVWAPLQLSWHHKVTAREILPSCLLSTSQHWLPQRILVKSTLEIIIKKTEKAFSRGSVITVITPYLRSAGYVYLQVASHSNTYSLHTKSDWTWSVLQDESMIVRSTRYTAGITDITPYTRQPATACCNPRFSTLCNTICIAAYKHSERQLVRDSWLFPFTC